MSRFALGYRRRADDRHPMKRAITAFARSALPKSVDLTPFCPVQILDQGQTGSCVGHARALQIFVAKGFKGQAVEMPSPVFLYRVARCYERASWDQPLEDNGCDPVDSIRGALAFGMAPMIPLAWRYSDADPLTVNDPPDMLALLSGFSNIGGDHHLVTATGAEKITTVMAALAQGCPVAIDVDAGGASWQLYETGVLKATAVNTNHYVCLVGYQVLDTGDVVFKGQNSWGQYWGEGGRFRCDESVILQALDPIVYVP